MYFFFIDIEMEYAVHLLPYILTAPLRKTKRYSANEASEHFIHMSPVVIFVLSIVNLQVVDG